MIKVTFMWDAEPDERDDEDPTGLTAATFESLSEDLMALGAQDIRIEKR